MLWEPCNHLQVTTLKTLLLMNRSIAETFAKGTGWHWELCLAFQFFHKKIKGNQSGSTVAVLQMKPGHLATGWVVRESSAAPQLP